METHNQMLLQKKPNTFNFLASLINGNVKAFSLSYYGAHPFNFLASLINGNLPQQGGRHFLAVAKKSFNFLASLINGNTKHSGCSTDFSFNFLASLINGNPLFSPLHNRFRYF
jgi:mitochondrial fission protein ELM1